ncbi:MAG: penicillin-binding protein 2 [Leptospiraceae bacterium]|nr:penicillin-binding protein 2 [Leptospiraceae bacterium]
MNRRSISSIEHKLESSFRLRLYIFTGAIGLTLLIFIAQLANLQLVQGQENTLKAERFVRRSESLPAARGQVYDRNFSAPETSKPLVSNSSSLDVVVNKALFKNDVNKIREFIFKFYRTLSIPRSYYEKEIKEDKIKKKIRSKSSIVLLQGISTKQHERIASFDNISKYINFIPTPKRIYHMGPALAHISGYVGLPSKKDMTIREIKSYQLVGKSGLEFQYDQYLRGIDGFRYKKPNSEGGIDDERIVEHAVMGNNLILTIDQNVQYEAYSSLKNYRGAVIAIKPATGEIIALASNPSFDPNILSGKNRKLRRSHYARILKNRGFLNLAIQSKFPPASTYKTLVGLAALESEHKINYNPNQTYHCNSKFVLHSSMASVPDQVFLCWDKKGHGTNDLMHALEKSCSVYFYNLGQKLGSEPIIYYSRLFGLDKRTKLDLPGEIEGFVPSGEWKKRSYGTKWFDGDTVNLSIGQGFISVTPIAMALFYSAIANNGKVYQPYLVSEMRNPLDNSVIFKTTPRILRDIPIKASTLSALRQGLRLVGKTGTASRVLNQPDVPEVAGKTGTAQTKRKGHSSSNHAWFIGYAPFNAPVEEQVLVAVFVEHGVGGAVGAGPIARNVFKAAFPPGTFVKTDQVETQRMSEETPQSQDVQGSEESESKDSDNVEEINEILDPEVTEEEE